MHTRHMPTVNARYWLAITLASLFGTNMGDLYAHNSGLGLLGGLPILVALAAVVWLVERRDTAPREVYYWLLIIIIRTGATNIADYFKHHIPALVFGILLTVLLAGFGWASTRDTGLKERVVEQTKGMPQAGGSYWSAMLTAGVFGTFVGDVASQFVGQGPASIGLGILLALAIAAWWQVRGRLVWFYWVPVAVVRTAGTAMGDFLAENPRLDIGLLVSTAITGACFVAVLVAWPRLRAGRAMSAV